MGYRQRLILVCLVTLAAVSFGCQRDGFECSDDDECFSGEVCLAGICSAQECQPEPDGELCASRGDCGETLEFTDRCGASRSVFCGCSNNGNNVCVSEEDSALCLAAGATCGELVATDRCEEPRTVQCGACPDSETCVENQCARCAPPACADSPDACGVARNLCGEEVVCGGTCPAGSTCIDTQCGDPIIAPDALSPGDRFGEEIRVDGAWLLIGAPGTAVDGVERAGVIYIYNVAEDGVQLVHRLENDAPQTDDGFGRVFDALDGRLLAIAGTRLLAYDLSTDTLAPAEPAELGRSTRDLTLRTRSDFLIGFADDPGGATLYAGECDPSGCAIESTWVPQPPEAGEIGLGYAMDTTDGVTLVGAPFDNVAGQSGPLPAGSFYWLGDSLEGVPNATGWSDGPSQFLWDNFNDLVGRLPSVGAGRSVSIDASGFAIVGAPETTPGNLVEESGVLFVYSDTPVERWTNGRRLVPPARFNFARCGHSVAMAGSSAFVACVYDGNRDDSLDTFREAQTSGTVYRYDFIEDIWELNRTNYRAPSPLLYDHYGWTLEPSAETVYVGAPGRNEDAGEVHMLSVN